MNTLQAEAFVLRFDAIARDVGRLRRRFRSNPDAWTGGYIVERIVEGIESLDGMIRPTAAELHDEYFRVCGDHDLAVQEALEHVDRRVGQLRWLLGAK